MRLILALILLWFPVGACAQGAATLLADRISLDADGRLLAEGNVTALFDGNRLNAAAITYDSRNDRLDITGPIIIEAADGTLLTASRATLDPRLENGLLQGARIVLDQRLQLAANQVALREGRYAQLYKTAATSCRVCGTGPPLWDIRAQEVIHDNDARQIYFRNATFRLRGVPLLWLPRMRLPDPTLARSTGLLVPQQQNTTLLGPGIKLPYFITLGDHRDLTLTPYLARETRTLELRYRQAFRNGDITVEGAVSDDSLRRKARSYLFADGAFDLAGGYHLDFGLQSVSDRAYLLSYDYADQNRLQSALRLRKVTDDSLLRARGSLFQTLRSDEDNARLPPIVADLSGERRLQTRWGGQLHYGGSIDLGYRTSDIAGDAGRDVLRIGGFGTWQTGRALAGGLLATAETGLRTDFYAVDDDPAFDDHLARLTPQMGVDLRWPLIRSGPSGAQHLLEPVVALGWATNLGDSPPNEDSLRTELDRANLTAGSRFAGQDRIEDGAQAAIGLTWTRTGAKGGASTVSFGRILRPQAQDGFTQTSGLDGAQSDWLVAAQLATTGGVVIDARSLWDADDGLRVADARAVWSTDVIGLGANYIWLEPDSDEGRDATISEWTVDADVMLSDGWDLGVDARYDIAADRPVRAGIGLTWRNECVSVDLSASRRFADSDTVEPTTDFGISGTIGSFDAGQTASAACRK